MRLRTTLPAFLAAAVTLVNGAPSRYVAPSDKESNDLLTLNSTNNKRAVDFNWGSTKVRGVNLGGWLVLES